MRFQVIASIMAVMATSALANLHNNAICVNYTGDVSIYNADATKAACDSYKAANTGSNWWDTCPDCVLITGNEYDYCNSAGEHLGGNEITAFCEQAGADNALTS